jgi:hypothetical protein
MTTPYRLSQFLEAFELKFSTANALITIYSLGSNADTNHAIQSVFKYDGSTHITKSVKAAKMSSGFTPYQTIQTQPRKCLCTSANSYLWGSLICSNRLSFTGLAANRSMMHCVEIRKDGRNFRLMGVYLFND